MYEKAASNLRLSELGSVKKSARVLAVENVRADYGKREVLRGVSLGVGQGEIVAVIGPNGAGKSTLLKVVAGLLSVRAGHVLLCDQDVTSLPIHRRADAGIGYVIQGGAIFPSLNVEDHLRLARQIARRNGRIQRHASDRELLAPALMSRRDPAGLFSGGQRQALAVATVLATEPTLLLCDEPSAGLSPALAKELIERIAHLSRERGLPVLWVEQRIGELLPLADRAVLLRDGSLAAETSSPSGWLGGDVLAELTFGEAPCG